MKRVGSIYVITNTVTSEQYVGLTRQKVKRRWAAHRATAYCSKAKHYKLHDAINKYGSEAFDVQEIFVAFDKEYLAESEIYFISEYKPSYNILRGGSGFRPVVVSEEIKKKRSEDAKKRWSNPEWKAKTIASLKKAAQTEEARQRAIALKKYQGGKIRWANHVKKVYIPADRSAVIKKSWENPSIREKRIKNIKTTLSTPKAKLRLKMALLGRKMPKESIKKSAKAKWKPIFCPELQVSFLCQGYAAEALNVVRATVSNAIKTKGKVSGQYTLIRVA